MSQIRVDFYLLNDKEPQAKWLVACRLLEKAYLRGHRVFVFCDSKEQAETLDELLWTYKDDSFVPHHLQGEGPEPPPPVQIGYGQEPRGYNDLILNLSNHIPTFFIRFRRIMEIVGTLDAEKENSRQHYKEYKARNCEIHTWTL